MVPVWIKFQQEIRIMEKDIICDEIPQDKENSH